MINFDNDVTIHKSEMSREMEGEAVALVRHAMSIQQTDKDVVKYVVTEMNERQPADSGGAWECFVGEGLQAMSLGQRLNVDHIEGTYLYFNLGGGGGKEDVLLYKSSLM